MCSGDCKAKKDRSFFRHRTEQLERVETQNSFEHGANLNREEYKRNNDAVWKDDPGQDCHSVETYQYSIKGRLQIFEPTRAYRSPYQGGNKRNSHPNTYSG